jgi:hypothetical protein
MKNSNSFKVIALAGLFCLFSTAWWGSGLLAAENLPQDILDAQQQNQAMCELVNPLSDPPVIVIGSGASESEKYAAEELSKFLGQITGRQIKITAEGSAPQAAKIIAVGKSKLTDKYDISSLGVEQYIIDIQPDKIAIVGGRKPPVKGGDGKTYVNERGTLYGVYEFLEDLGVRWYRPEPWGWYVPDRKTIELPVGKKVSRPPAFLARSSVRMTNHLADAARNEQQQQYTQAWAARQRLNVRTSEDPRYGGTVAFIPNWHTQSRVIVQPGRYLKSHPEYFALVNGKRGDPGTGRTPQLCLGNPQLQEVFAENVIKLAKENPQWSLVAIDPEDGTQLGTRMCTCPLCIAMDDSKHPTLMSNRVFAFANIIAKRLAKAVPGAKVGLYAYSMHTQVPTLVEKLEPNVIVALANINSWSDWTRPMFDPNSAQNAQFVQLAAEWKAISPHKLWMREYAAYGWLGPVPMYRLLQDRAQSYRKMGFEGIIWPGEPNWGPQMLLLYFKARLQWDPDLDLEKELNLFYANYYGPAAKPMKAYYETWMNAFEHSNIGSGINGGISSGGRGMHVLCSPALMKKLGEDMEAAAKLVKGNALYERRLKGAEAGYELCRRVGDILSLKMADGQPTPQPRNASVKYLNSARAEQAWKSLETWLATANKDDLNFDIQIKEGKPSAVGLTYMKRDILINGRYSLWNERALLESQGFAKAKDETH